MHPPITITAADAQETAKDDAKPAPIPDVSYALTILRERILKLDKEISDAADIESRFTEPVARMIRRSRGTLENSRDDLRKIERALLGDERIAEQGR